MWYVMLEKPTAGVCLRKVLRAHMSHFISLGEGWMMGVVGNVPKQKQYCAESLAGTDLP